MRYLFELSGEHPTLPVAEVMATVRAECDLDTEPIMGIGTLVVDLPASSFQSVSERLGLSHRAGRLLSICDLPELDRVLESLSIPEGSIAVRCHRVERHMIDVAPMDLARHIGARLNRPVDLGSPDNPIRVLMADRLYMFLDEWRIDRRSFESRKVEMRPFFSPISLHPKFARALVNLTSVRRGERLLDPFCGTGGILMEASLVGARAIGTDFDPVMIEGAKRNMEHFNIGYDALEVCDVGDVADTVGMVDVIATDPPYGRSTRIGNDTLDTLYGRSMISFSKALRHDGRLAMVLPVPCPPAVDGLETIQGHHQRVHRSLDRHYCLLRSR